MQSLNDILDEGKLEDEIEMVDQENHDVEDVDILTEASDIPDNNKNNIVDQGVMDVIRMNPDVFDAESDAEVLDDGTEFDAWEEFDEEWEGI